MLTSLERLDNFLEESLPKNNYVINCGDLATRLTVDMTGNNLMGIDMTTLTRGTNEVNEFLKYSNMVRGTYWNIIIKTIMKKTCPRLYDRIGYYLFNNAKTTQFYFNFILDIMKYRKTHAIVRPDLISVLMELKKNPGKLPELIGKIFTILYLN